VISDITVVEVVPPDGAISLSATYDSNLEDLHLEFVQVTPKGIGLGTRAVSEALRRALEMGTVASITGVLSMDNLFIARTDGHLSCPAAKIRIKIGHKNILFNDVSLVLCGCYEIGRCDHVI
jgi:hypothetical protein